MPKRNRHREAMKAGTTAPPLSARTATTAAAPASKPCGGNASASRPPAQPADPEKRLRTKREREDRYRDRLKLKAPAILAELTARWPEAFPEDKGLIRPWAIGITNEIAKHGLPYSKNLIRAALKTIAKSEAYQAALIAGGPRYDLDGKAKGEVTAEQKAEAVKMLAEIRAKKAGTA